MLFENHNTQSLEPLNVGGKLMVDVSPWHFAIEVETIAIHSKYIKIKIRSENTGEYLSPFDLNEFIDEENIVSLQLDDERFKHAVSSLECSVVGKGLISDHELHLELKLSQHCEELNFIIDDIHESRSQ